MSSRSGGGTRRAISRADQNAAAPNAKAEVTETRRGRDGVLQHEVRVTRADGTVYRYAITARTRTEAKAQALERAANERWRVPASVESRMEAVARDASYQAERAAYVANRDDPAALRTRYGDNLEGAPGLLARDNLPIFAEVDRYVQQHGALPEGRALDELVTEIATRVGQTKGLFEAANLPFPGRSGVNVAVAVEIRLEHYHNDPQGQRALARAARAATPSATRAPHAGSRDGGHGKASNAEKPAPKAPKGPTLTSARTQLREHDARLSAADAALNRAVSSPKDSQDFHRSYQALEAARQAREQFLASLPETMRAKLTAAPASRAPRSRAKKAS